MITQITINNVASFSKQTSLSTNKKVNLIYGLNGTGKSTISNYLSNINDPMYADCSISGLDSSCNVCVYNQKFVDNNFYASDELKGIFTLAKQNTEAEKNIATITNSIKSLDAEKTQLSSEKIELEFDKEKLLDSIRNDVWKIKQTYSGGDRVLEYCFDNLKRKENLYTYLLSIPKPDSEPEFTIATLKKEVEAIADDTSKVLDELEMINVNDNNVINNPIWGKIIVGNSNSTLSDVVEKLNNSDWIKIGTRFIDLSTDREQTCPFCQEKTITPNFIKNLKMLFDKSYDEDMARLNQLYAIYSKLLDGLADYEIVPDNKLYSELLKTLKLKQKELHLIYDKNKKIILQKINQPSIIVQPSGIEQLIADMNDIITEINKVIQIFNEKIKNKEKTLTSIKKQFWLLMRWKYTQSIESSNKNITAKGNLIKDCEKKLVEIEDKINNLKTQLKNEQSKTINISEAVDNIKAGLIDLGIDSFTIENYKDNFYKLVRPGKTEKTFATLSEGEKMIISFLYFVEMCKGKMDIANTATKKIVVIDDPISSLSHIYVFNISQLIKNYFTNPNSEYEQVFILTHSLYFFYDLTFMKSDDREEYQNLYRLIKNENGSRIAPMKYAEIQNDYHSYWQVVKDPDQPPALIANCMRNIIEYFFGFVEKYELSSVFQKEPLKDNKYQAFYRYVNRESHSFAQNVFDIKEFDYDAFKEAFKLIFEQTGYDAHYKKMIK